MRFVHHKLEQPRSLTVGVQLVRLGFENEIDAFRFAARESDILRLRSVRFVPCGDGVFAGWQIFQAEATVLVGNAEVVRLQNNDVSMHPGMDIALHWNEFRLLKFGVERSSSGRL